MEALKITLAKFFKSNKGANDYVELLLVAAKNAGNMGWDEIEKIVREVLEGSVVKREQRKAGRYVDKI